MQCAAGRQLQSLCSIGSRSIPSSRSASRGPSRAASVKGGRRPAPALPLTGASTMARFRPFGGGVHSWKAIITAIAVKVTVGSISVVYAASAQAQSVPMATANLADLYAADIAEASRRFGIPERWIRAVMRVESGGRVRAVSPKGAIGLMQIMPDSWAGLRQRCRLGRDPYDPHDNILAGAAYLREMHDRYGTAGFLAAYNAGPGRDRPQFACGNARLCRGACAVGWRRSG